MDGGAELSSDVVLNAQDGSSVTLTPDTISEGSLTVTIPGTLPPGNYKLKTTKLGKYSNPTVIIIKPDVIINDVTCKRKTGRITINGSGFGEKPEGTDDYLNVDVNSQRGDILFWSDTQIMVSVSSCSNQGNSVIVNTLFGSATN
jgi:hypothetical protein